MTNEEFISLLDLLGANVARWPAPLQNRAAMLLEHSDKARASLKAMQEVEGLLAHSSAAPLLDIAAMAARASRRSQPGRSIMGPGLRKASFAALGVMALAAGILVGITPPTDAAIVGSVQMALNGGAADVW